MFIYSYLIGFYFLCIIQSSMCDICSTCSCSLINGERQINCSGKHLRNNDMLNFDLLTLNSHRRLNKLILSKNNIDNLPRNLLQKLKLLKSLDISENVIEKIFTTMFFDLNDLEDLNLSKNSLQTFDISLLEVLPTLLTLNLSHNHIDSIEHIMNKNATKINTLDLSYNNIFNLSKEFSEALSNVQYLDLSFNKIHFLQDCNLIYLNSLKVIRINNNFLTELNMQMLPKKLVELYSGYNEITEILYSLPYIKVLNVEHNKISSIHANLTMDNVQQLNVCGNVLSNFPNILLENLKILNLCNNKLIGIPKTISTKNFPLLSQLDISQNPIKNLTIISDLKLNSFIANNMSLLKSIDKDTFANLRSPLKQCINLTISNNKMLSFVHEDALKDMNVCSLDLSNNQLTYVAQKLIMRKGTNETSSINLQKNPFECNCTLQWLLDDLVPKLYSHQPQLLDNLRCASPPEISNVRMVHWYGWEYEIFCTDKSYFNENLTMNIANVINNNETVKVQGSSGMIVIVGLATTMLTILVVAGIILKHRMFLKKRRINRIF
ncbi:uncharacterized protein LOC143428993 [Xylocopa sonorina]|uniref:uncharacterized protein LOC143428993 n=1 Tax=Xylocopa sonorina TaxID=1818115 RepID=UPI00403A9ABC